MSINMILGSAQSQTNSIKNLTTSQIGSYQQIQQALSNFMFQTNSLQGAAYDSAKAYCGSVLSPLIDGCILLNKAIEKANEEYINKYTSEVYGESLKQSDLERLIDETKSQIALNENLLNEQFEQDPVDLSEVSNLQEKIDSYRKIQRDLEEKLSKLLAFDANSVSIFQEVDVLSYSVAQGIALAQRSWSPTLKTFMLPGKNEMGWVGTIKEIWEKNNKESNKTNSIKSSKRMINSQISAEEYDRYVAHYSGLHGKPIIGASVIHNASSEEKKDLVLAILPWIMPGGSLRLTMLSGGTLGLIDGLVSKDKPSDVIKKMAFGSGFAFASNLGFSLLSKGTKVKNFFKSGENAENKLLKNLKNESLRSKNNLSQRGSTNHVKIAENGIDGKLKPTILYNAKEFPRELKKYPRDMVLNNTNNKIITLPRNEKLRNNLVQKTTNEQSRLLNQIEKEKVNTQIVYGKKEFLEEMDRLPKVDLSKRVEDGLISTPNGDRPRPKSYLSKEEINTHLKLFEDGVVKVMSEERYLNIKEKRGGYIGPKSGHYVMPKFIYEKAVKASNGNPRVLEELLGLEKGFLGENPVAIEAKRLEFLKFPSGNEDGAYQGLWEPAGYTKGGIPEAVINQLAPGDYVKKQVYMKGSIK